MTFVDIPVPMFRSIAGWLSGRPGRGRIAARRGKNLLRIMLRRAMRIPKNLPGFRMALKERIAKYQ
jgi:hypothetical protein